MHQISHEIIPPIVVVSLVTFGEDQPGATEDCLWRTAGQTDPPKTSAIAIK